MFSLPLTTGTELEEGKVLIVDQLAESATARTWCTLSLTLMISRTRLVFQKLLADTDAYWDHPNHVDCCLRYHPRSQLLGRSWWWLTFLPPGSNCPTLTLGGFGTEFQVWALQDDCPSS